MTHTFSRLAFRASALLLFSTTACIGQRTVPPMVMASVPSMATNDDASVTTAFRALLDELIGDSADEVCLSVARPDGSDADPSSSVVRALRARRSTTLLPHSVCVEDERNFGNPHGLLRLRDVSPGDEHTLIVHAEAIADHSARYECLVPRAGRARCKMTARDWPGSQTRG